GEAFDLAGRQIQAPHDVVARVGDVELTVGAELEIFGQAQERAGRGSAVARRSGHRALPGDRADDLLGRLAVADDAVAARADFPDAVIEAVGDVKRAVGAEDHRPARRRVVGTIDDRVRRERKPGHRRRTAVAGVAGAGGRRAGADAVGDRVRVVGGDAAHAAVPFVADEDVAVLVDRDRVDEVQARRRRRATVADVARRL